MKQLSILDLVQNQLQNPVFHQLATAPSTPVKGQFYMSTVTNTLHYYNGTTDYDTGFAAHSISELLAPTANIPLAGFKFTGSANGTNPQDLVTVAQLQASSDAAIAGLAIKQPIKAVITTNQTIATPAASFDGVTFINGDRILLVAQTTPSQNGPYIYNSTGLVRAGDAAQNFELQEGSTWLVTEGTIGASQQWRLSNIGTITPGTTSVTPVLLYNAVAYTATGGVVLTGTSFSVQRTVGNASYVPFKTAGTLGDGSTLSYIIADGYPIDKKAVIRDVSSGLEEQCDVKYAAGQTTFIFTVAPPTNSIAYVIFG